MAANVEWHGTQQEAIELQAAIMHNCECVYGENGIKETVCAAHKMLTQDQRALNGLLCARRTVRALTEKEWHDDTDAQP